MNIRLIYFAYRVGRVVGMISAYYILAKQIFDKVDKLKGK
jgi:uncharacterized membrane protein